MGAESLPKQAGHLGKIAREAEFFLRDQKDLSPERLIEDLQKQVEVYASDRQRLEELAELMRLAGEGEHVQALARDGQFAFAASPDSMTLTVTIDPPIAGGAAVTAQAITAELIKRGIRRGVDAQAIDEAVAEAAAGARVENRTIVRGKAPGAPVPERLQLFARPSHEDPPQGVTLEELNRDRQPVCLCREGDLVLSLTPARAGSPGFDALNRPIAPQLPPSTEVTVGSHVTRDEHNYYATAPGRVMFDGNRLEVRKVLLLDRDLTKEDGPINYDGEAHIRGGVRSGASLKASGDILVEGLVEDATIVSTGGSVRLLRGVTGRNRGSVTAAGDVTTRFAENAAVFAGQTLTVGVGAINSRLTAGISVLLVQGRGQCVGGVILAGQRVELRHLGSASEIPTEVSAGIGLEALKQMMDLDGKITEARERGEQAREMADKMQRLVGDPSKLPHEQLGTFVKLRQVQLAMEMKVRELQVQRNQLLDTAAGQSDDATIIIHQALMPGVTLRIGAVSMTNQQQQGRCAITRKPGQSGLVVSRI